jgi:hypothetical protein
VKRLSLGLVNQTIALLIFMVVAVVPLYSQTAKQSPETRSNVSEQPAAVSKPGNAESSAQTTQTAPVQKSATQTTPQPYVFPTRRERFNRYLKSTVGPFSLARSAISAGIDQARDTPDEWEQGASGYGKRYASSFGQNAIQQTVIYGLDSALGLDTGFRKSERKGLFPRMTDALVENVISRTRSGKKVISVPRFTGAYASAFISHEAWYPERYGYKDALRSGTRSWVSGFGLNLLREFVIRF